jgi:hypothetical protein
MHLWLCLNYRQSRLNNICKSTILSLKQFLVILYYVFNLFMILLGRSDFKKTAIGILQGLGDLTVFDKVTFNIVAGPLTTFTQIF